MADPTLQSFLAQHEQSETQHIPHQRSICCCGNDSCAYLKQNQSALDELERDVSNAARLGQALLMRHEAYITESEEERKTMAAHIESLEADKLLLERKNATAIEENRNLLDQLEALNNAVADSDAHVTSLQATLASAQRETQKLAQLASRTEDLDRQLAEFEREQATWQSTLEEKKQSERSAVRRWQTAERTLSQVQEQIEQIEREAREEKERHAEIVERMERRHAVERELGSAAGRLKGAAALKNGDRNGADTGVVSHFVKDILQDNTNLQIGIVELREMLNNSNEEVENLRNQLSLHQPAEDDEGTTFGTITRKDLSAELNRANSQELHVHHHYHAPPAAKPPTVRRTKKKKYGAINSGQLTPPSGASTPRSSFSYSTPTSAATILQQTAASVPQSSSGGKRLSTLSTMSNQTFYSIIGSSGPSSPQSTANRTSSIFDRVFSDAGHESSRPTTPDTEDPGSPTLSAAHSSKRGSGSWSRTYSAPIVQRHGIMTSAARPSLDAIMSIEELPKLEQQELDAEPIPEEDDNHNTDEVVGESSTAVDTDDTMVSPTPEEFQEPLQKGSFRPPTLRRATSHDSLLSVAGMDIHTSKTRPSQLLAPLAGRALTSQAVISGTTAHAARPVAMSRESASGRNILSGLAMDTRQSVKPTLGKKVGGWMFGRWGATPATPAPATTKVTPAAATSGGRTASIVSAETKKDSVEKQASPKMPKIKASGTDQSGSTQGFLPIVAKAQAQTAPVVNSLDEEALKSVLAGD